MASPHEKLAESLEVLRALQERGVVAVRSADLTRTHRERLFSVPAELVSCGSGFFLKNTTDARTNPQTISGRPWPDRAGLLR
jgi:hypothetical protein